MIGIAETWDTRVHDICFQSATALAQALRRREIGSRELLELFVRRVERFNPTLNATNE